VGKKMLCYDKLWKLLIDKKIKKGELCRRANISNATLAKMGKGESVTLTVMEKICRELDCEISDIVDVIEEDIADSEQEDLTDMDLNQLCKKYYVPFHLMITATKEVGEDQDKVARWLIDYMEENGCLELRS